MIKLPRQPRCRFCGARIAKWTETVRFIESGREGRTYSSVGRAIYVDEPPRSKAEAQRFLNEPIVSVHYAEIWDVLAYPDDPESRVVSSKRIGRFVDYVTVWDGETYVDEYFCNGDHAKRFAYLLAVEGRCTSAYNEAVRADVSRETAEQ